jgi:hypothetical protein
MYTHLHGEQIRVFGSVEMLQANQIQTFVNTKDQIEKIRAI